MLMLMILMLTKRLFAHFSQIQLEKIRQADSEVRWQHEDDVNECNSCNKRLASKKDKVSSW